MSDTYTKLFSSITESTVWGEAYPTRIVWVTMLAMVDAQGNVYGSVPGLARRANVTVTEAEAALAAFQAPDQYSRTKDDDGRRVREIDGGWHLINHGKYAAVRDETERREYKREWDRANRPSGHARAAVRQQSDESPTNPTDPTPPALTPSLTPEEQKQKKGRSAPLVLPEWVPADAWDDWNAYRNSGKGWTAKARELSLRTLTELHAQGHDARVVIELAIERGWRGLFPPRAGPPSGTQRVGQDSKTLTGMKALQGMKHGLVHDRNHRRAHEVDVVEPGPDSRRRLGSDHGGDVD